MYRRTGQSPPRAWRGKYSLCLSYSIQRERSPRPHLTYSSTWRKHARHGCGMRVQREKITAVAAIAETTTAVAPCEHSTAIADKTFVVFLQVTALRR